MAAHPQVSWGLILIVLVTLAGCSGSGTEESDPVMVTVSGRAVDSRGNPVSGATIIIDGQPADVQTNADGDFSVELEAGDHELTIMKGPDVIAVIPVSVSEGGPSELGEIAPTASYYPWYEDSDEDGFGNSDVIVNEEAQPLGYVINGDDCDDSAPSINPGATEICNSVDDNCDSNIDEGVLLSFYQDSDVDGFGNLQVTQQSCSVPEGYVADDTDCDDSAASVNPGATEICNGVDDNCNLGIDEGVLLSFYQDFDVDGFGNLQVTQQSCSVPEGYVADDTDCDDSAASVNPGATEICNSVDDNCNSEIDEGVLLTFYRDFDVDGFGSWMGRQQSCSAPEGYVSDHTDCDDWEPSIHPGAPEVCNGADDNCDAQVDEGVTITFYRDADEDNYGNTDNSIEACTNPMGYLTDNTDCDDTEPGLNPETVWYLDGDQDNYPINSNALMQCLAPAGSNVPDYLFTLFDCDDSDPLINPGNLEIIGNSIDDDCNSGTLDSAAVYSMSDLQGGWKLYGVNAGDYTNDEWNGWMQGTVSFDDKGQLTDYFLEYDDGFVETDPDISFIRIDSEGIVTVAGDPMFHGAISQDKDMIVATNTDLEGGYTMLILQKAAAAVTLADFKGLWNTHAVVAGDDPRWSGWYRGTVDVLDTGTMNFSLDRSDNVQDAGFVRADVNPGGDLENHWNLRSISDDRQLAVGRVNYEDGFGLEVLTKSGGDFAPGNLEGDWSFHVLSVGDAPEINGWAHGMMHFDSTGTGTVNYQASSDPTSAISVDTLSVDSAGKILSSTIQTFAGTLSSNKDTIVATFTNQSGGASIMIALRRDPPPLGISTEDSISASAIISPAVGGDLQVIASDGTQFDLAIPPDAIESDRDVLIKMTPMAGLNELPISGNFIGGVQLAPEGMQLSIPARLTVKLPAPLPVSDLLSFVFQGSGSQFHFLPVLPDAGTTSTSSFDIPLWHFSGSGGGTGTSGDAASLPFNAGSGADYYQSQIASITQDLGVPALNPQNPDAPAIDATAISRLKAVFVAWFDNWVWERQVNLVDTADEVKRAVREYLRWEVGIMQVASKYRIWGHWDPIGKGWDTDISQVYPGAFDKVDKKISDTIQSALEKLDNECAEFRPGSYPPEFIGYNDPCNTGIRLLHEAIPWIELSIELDQRADWSVTAWNPAEFCNGLATLVAGTAVIAPRGAIIKPNGEAQFEAVLIDMTEQNEIEPLWISTDPTVASVSQDGNVRGESSGGAFISAYDSLQCHSASAFVVVDASGPYHISIEGRASDNCHYNEAPDFVPIPTALSPESVMLTHSPLTGDPDKRFELYWSGGIQMSGLSTNSTEVKISGAAEATLSVGHLLMFEQSCYLDFSRVGFDGYCEFHKFEFINIPTPVDQCKGKYWISGVRF